MRMKTKLSLSSTPRTRDALAMITRSSGPLWRTPRLLKLLLNLHKVFLLLNALRDVPLEVRGTGPIGLLTSGIAMELLMFGSSDDRAKADSLDQSATLEPEKPVDEDAEIERRRKRREEILRKSRASTPALQALQIDAAATTPGSSVLVGTPRRTEVNTPRSGKPVYPLTPYVSSC
jgi:hypothetical protein